MHLTLFSSHKNYVGPVLFLVPTYYVQNNQIILSKRILKNSNKIYKKYKNRIKQYDTCRVGLKCLCPIKSSNCLAEDNADDTSDGGKKRAYVIFTASQFYPKQS